MLLLRMDALDLAVNAVILVTTVWSGVEYFVKNHDVLNRRSDKRTVEKACFRDFKCRRKV